MFFKSIYILFKVDKHIYKSKILKKIDYWSYFWYIITKTKYYKEEIDPKIDKYLKKTFIYFLNFVLN